MEFTSPVGMFRRKISMPFKYATAPSTHLSCSTTLLSAAASGTLKARRNQVVMCLFLSSSA